MNISLSAPYIDCFNRLDASLVYCNQVQSWGGMLIVGNASVYSDQNNNLILNNIVPNANIYFEVDSDPIIALEAAGTFPGINATHALDLLHHNIFNVSCLSVSHVSVTNRVDSYNISATNFSCVNASIYYLFVDPFTCENASF